MVVLSARVEAVLLRLFRPEERDEARRILSDECGARLPFLENGDAGAFERVHLAVLKLSSGDLRKLRRAAADAGADWRDVLMAAGFGEDPEAHTRWMP